MKFLLCLALVFSLHGAAFGQQVGTNTAENHPPLTVQSCIKAGGCTSQQKSVVVDANWR